MNRDKDCGKKKQENYRLIFSIIKSKLNANEHSYGTFQKLVPCYKAFFPSKKVLNPLTFLVTVNLFLSQIYDVSYSTDTAINLMPYILQATESGSKNYTFRKIE